MSKERLITLPQAAELLGITYGTLNGRYTRHEFGLPEAVADKAKRGADLYRAADFIEYKKTGGKRRGLNNELAQLFITYQIGCKPAGVSL
jgi:hypothetical protein